MEHKENIGIRVCMYWEGEALLCPEDKQRDVATASTFLRSFRFGPFCSL